MPRSRHMPPKRDFLDAIRWLVLLIADDKGHPDRLPLELLDLDHLAGNRGAIHIRHAVRFAKKIIHLNSFLGTAGGKLRSDPTGYSPIVKIKSYAPVTGS